jgi:hypothetical protein
MGSIVDEESKFVVILDEKRFFIRALFFEARRHTVQSAGLANPILQSWM